MATPKEDFATTSNIHGWNPAYQTTTSTSAEQYKSFTPSSNPRRDPSSFNNQPLKVSSGPSVHLFDHQGHIVPQNLLTNVLKPCAEKLVTFCEGNPEKVPDFIAAGQEEYNFLVPMQRYMEFLQEENKKMPAFFELDEPSLDDQCGRFFSIAMWNPANICRAPSDNYRNGVPGNRIDTEVASYISESASEVTHTEAVFKAIGDLHDSQSEANIIKFLNAICDTLDGQQESGNGFYKFPWKNIGTSSKPNMQPG